MKLTNESQTLLKSINSIKNIHLDSLNKKNENFIIKMYKILDKGNDFINAKKTSCSKNTISNNNLDSLVPLIIKNDIINNYIYKYSTTFIVNKRTIHIHLFYADSENNKKLLTCFNKIFLLLYFVTYYAKTTNSMNVNINIYFTNHKKLLPKSNEFVPLNINNVNSAFTTPCSSDSEINIFRKEEWFKVLAHELMHNMNLDFACMNSSYADNVMFQLFNLKKHDIRLYESYTESWAIIINSLFISFYNTRDKSNYELMITKFNNIINNEILFSLLQLKKVLNYNKITYEDLLNNDRISLEKKSKYSENTYVISYYIIKIILLFNKNKYLNWCAETNKSIAFKNNEETISSFCQLIYDLYRNEIFLDVMQKVRLSKITNSQSLRMSAYEMEN